MDSSILDATPNFQENLTRAFKNEGVRRLQMRKQDFTHPLDNILFNHHESQIELRDLVLHWIPDFRVSQLKPDLLNHHLEMQMNLNKICIKGEYEINNSELQKILPVTQIGKITMLFNNVRAEGRVGLLIEEDSFVPENYDINYQLSEILIKVNYYVDNHNETETEITNSNLEATIGQTIWIQATEKLNNLLHIQLSESIVEFSISELLNDQEDEYREFSRVQALKTNRLIDSLLCTAKDYLVTKKLQNIETPSFNIIYKGKALGCLDIQQGHIEDLSTLTRFHSFSLFETQEYYEIYGYLNMKDFKFKCEFSKENEINGNIKTSIYENKIFMKIVVCKVEEEKRSKLEHVQVRLVKEIDVDITGLGSLRCMASKLEFWIKGNLWFNVLPILEKNIKEAFNFTLANLFISEIK